MKSGRAHSLGLSNRSNGIRLIKLVKIAIKFLLAPLALIVDYTFGLPSRKRSVMTNTWFVVKKLHQHAIRRRCLDIGDI